MLHQQLSLTLTWQPSSLTMTTIFFDNGSHIIGNIPTFLMLKGEVYFMEKNDWQLEIKYRKRKSVRFSTRMLWWIILAQEKIRVLNCCFHVKSDT